MRYLLVMTALTIPILLVCPGKILADSDLNVGFESPRIQPVARASVRWSFENKTFQVPSLVPGHTIGPIAFQRGDSLIVVGFGGELLDVRPAIGQFFVRADPGGRTRLYHISASNIPRYPHMLTCESPLGEPTWTVPGFFASAVVSRSGRTLIPIEDAVLAGSSDDTLTLAVTQLDVDGTYRVCSKGRTALAAAFAGDQEEASVVTGAGEVIRFFHNVEVSQLSSDGRLTSTVRVGVASPQGLYRTRRGETFLLAQLGNVRNAGRFVGDQGDWRLLDIGPTGSIVASHDWPLGMKFTPWDSLLASLKRPYLAGATLAVDSSEKAVLVVRNYVQSDPPEQHFVVTYYDPALHSLNDIAILDLNELTTTGPYLLSAAVHRRPEGDALTVAIIFDTRELPGSVLATLNILPGRVSPVPTVRIARDQVLLLPEHGSVAGTRIEFLADSILSVVHGGGVYAIRVN